MARKKSRMTNDAVEILDRRYFEGQAERIAELEAARASATIARTAYGLVPKRGSPGRNWRDGSASPKLCETGIWGRKRLAPLVKEGAKLAQLSREGAKLAPPSAERRLLKTA